MRCVFRVAGDDYAGIMNWLIPDEDADWERMRWSSKRYWIFTIVADASLSRQCLAKVLCMGKHRAHSSGMMEKNSVMVRSLVFCSLLVISSNADTSKF